MDRQEINLVYDFILKKIPEANFLKEFRYDIKNPEILRGLLLKSKEEKNNEMFEALLLLVFKFDLLNNMENIVCDLIQDDWHKRHEDLALILQKLRSNSTVECLFKTALRKFDYLDYDDSFPLALKCIWALGDINSPQSIEKLKILGTSEEDRIKQAAIEQLKRLNVNN